MFYDNYVNLCKAKGIAPSKAAQEIGINKASVTNWKKKGYTPRVEILQRIASYFDVSMDYLLGNVSEPFLYQDERGLLQIDLDLLGGTKKKPTPVSGDGLDALGNELIDRLLRLEPDEIAKVDAFVQGLLAARGA